MSRLLLSSVLVALVAGLTLLACVPIEDGKWLGEVGDEFQVTDDTVVQHDPVFYNTEFGDSIKEAQIAYHDDSAIYLYDIASKTTESLYQAPSGYAITAMCTVKDGGHELRGLLFVLDGNGECIVIRELDGNYLELYRDSDISIQHIQFFSGIFTYLTLEREGSIYVFRDGLLIDNFEGYNPSCFYLSEAEYYYSMHYNGRSCIYECSYAYDEPIHYLSIDNGSNLYWPVEIADQVLNTELFITSDQNGSTDIYKVGSSNRLYQISEKDGVEKELSGWDKYVLFTRTVNGQTDVFIIRGDY
ncbi:hypothetical protein K8R78_05150 [bacterium]|nr:hypothetical protein [bacterium]